MGRAGSPLVPRVRALLDPAPRQRPALLVAAAAVAAFAAGCALHASADSEASFEQADPHHVMAAGHPPHALG
jgi:hypothetical protein